MARHPFPSPPCPCPAAICWAWEVLPPPPACSAWGLQPRRPSRRRRARRDSSRSCTAMPTGASADPGAVRGAASRPPNGRGAARSSEHRQGTFACAGCALPLFSSSTARERHRLAQLQRRCTTPSAKTATSPSGCCGWRCTAVAVAPPRPCVQRWPTPDGAALLHERCGDGVRSRRHGRYRRRPGGAGRFFPASGRRCCCCCLPASAALTLLSPCILPVLPFVFARADRSSCAARCRCCSGMASLHRGRQPGCGGQPMGGQANQVGRWVALLLMALFALALLWPRLADHLLPFQRLAQLSERVPMRRMPARRRVDLAADRRRHRPAVGVLRGADPRPGADRCRPAWRRVAPARCCWRMRGRDHRAGTGGVGGRPRVPRTAGAAWSRRRTACWAPRCWRWWRLVWAGIPASHPSFDGQHRTHREACWMRYPACSRRHRR